MRPSSRSGGTRISSSAWAWGLAVAATALPACEGEPPKAAPVASTRTAALYGGSEDPNTPEANVVVKLKGTYGECTGTLITPQIVLTASHCIHGSYNPAGGGNECEGTGPSPRVLLGSLPIDADLPSVFVATKVAGCQPSDRYGEDLALVYLTQPVVYRLAFCAADRLALESGKLVSAPAPWSVG